MVNKACVFLLLMILLGCLNIKDSVANDDKAIQEGIQAKEINMAFDAPSVLFINDINKIMQIYNDVKIDEMPYEPTEIQKKLVGEDQFWPRTIVYRKDSTQMHITFSKVGKITEVFISDDTYGRSKEDIMKLGNIKPHSNEYRVQIQNWLNPEYAKKKGCAEIAGVRITPKKR